MSLFLSVFMFIPPWPPLNNTIELCRSADSLQKGRGIDEIHMTQIQEMTGLVPDLSSLSAVSGVSGRSPCIVKCQILHLI